jgi:hypothetical protein
MSSEDFFLAGAVLLTLGLVGGAMVLGGGWEALRKQVWKLVVLGLAVVALDLVQRSVIARFGSGALTVTLVVVTVPLLFWMLSRNRRMFRQASLEGRQSPVKPAFWWLAGGFVVAVLGLSLAAAILFRD